MYEDRIEAFRGAYATYRTAQDRADAAFRNYFTKLQAGEATSGAAFSRLDNRANYALADLEAAALRLYQVDIDPATIVPEYNEI